MNRLGVLIAAAVMLVGASADATAQSVEGKWVVQYPTRVSMRNGEVHAEAMGTGALIIDRISGDSVFGTWNTMNSQDTTKKNEPRRIAGIVSGNKLVFVGAPEQVRIQRTMAGGGSPEPETGFAMRTYFEGTINGDTIEGTMYSKTEDESMTTPSTKWSAKRGN